MELLALKGIDDRRYVASSWGQPAHVRRGLKLNSPLPGQPSDGECAFHRSPLLYLFKYNMYMAAREKPLIWIGSRKKDLMALPLKVRKFFGHALDFAQRGDWHDAAKALASFGGASVLEMVEEARTAQSIP